MVWFAIFLQLLDIRFNFCSEKKKHETSSPIDMHQNARDGEMNKDTFMDELVPYYCFIAKI